MRKKLIFSMFLAVCLLLLNVFPAFAIESGDLSDPITEKAPTFQMQLVEEGDGQGLYGTLSYIPKNTVEIAVLYSFGGDKYYMVENKDAYGFRLWDLTGLNEGTASLTQLCIGKNDSPLKAYLHETVNTLSVKLVITQRLQDQSVATYTEAIKLSHNKAWEAPKLPPDFTARIEATGQGYLLKGKYTDFLPSTVRVRPMYSLDGEDYQVIFAEQPYDWHLDRLGAEDEAELNLRNNQLCAGPSVEPLKSYLAGDIDSFYTKLQITLENGTSYDTRPFRIDRGMVQPIPDDATISSVFPSSMRVRNMRPYYAYGKYQITVREDSGIEDIYDMLPDTVPVEVQIELAGTSSAPAIAYVETAVSWKDLSGISLQAGETLIINNAANSLVIPAGTQLHTPLGVYALTHDLLFDGISSRDEIRLAVNVIAKEEKPEVSLNGTLVDATEAPLPISLAFSLKPSSATKIMAYSYVEGDTGWTALCDLLTKRPINYNQSEQLYGYIDVLSPNASSYQRYLKGEIPGFLIALTIEGGVYDRETVILPWPGEYNPPAQVPELGGSGGNENNAGNGDGKDSDSSSNNGGQRPDLPVNEIPPVIPSSPDLHNPVPEPTPTLLPTPGPEPTPALPPTPGPEPTSKPTPTPAHTPTPGPEPTALPTEKSDGSSFHQGDSTSVSNPQEVDSNMAQQETSLNSNSSDPLVEPREDGKITVQPSITPDEPLVEPQDKPHKEAVSEQVFNPDEPSEQTTATPEERTSPNKTTIPKAVTVGVLAVGSVAAIGIAAGSTGTAASAGVVSKLIAVLRKLLFRK